MIADLSDLRSDEYSIFIMSYVSLFYFYQSFEINTVDYLNIIFVRRQISLILRTIINRNKIRSKIEINSLGLGLGLGLELRLGLGLGLGLGVGVGFG